MSDFPKKTDSAMTGIRGARLFSSMIPSSWGLLSFDDDFGIDLMCEIWTEEEVPELISRDVAFQIKARSISAEQQATHDRFCYETDSTTIPKYLKVAISRETLAYLCRSKGYLATVLLDFSWHDLGFFYQFFDLFEADARDRMMFRFDAKWQRQSEPMLSVTPLRPILELLERPEAVQTKSVRIPILPQSTGEVLSAAILRTEQPTFNLGQMLGITNSTEPTGATREPLERTPYKMAEYIELHQMLFYDSWKEITLGTLSSDFFNLIAKVQYSPYFLQDPTSFLTDVANVSEDVWVLAEVFLAALQIRNPQSSQDWVEDHIDDCSPFLNFLIMKCCRAHKVPLASGLVRYCRSGHRYAHPRLFSADPFDGQRGKRFLRRFYDEAIYYFIELIRRNEDQAETVFDMLTQDASADNGGFSYFFGQLTDGNVNKELGIVFAERLLLKRVAGSDKTGPLPPVLNVIRMLGELGIRCVDSSPSEK